MATVVILVAHGSRVAEAGVAHRAVCQQLARKLGDDTPVEPAFLELTDPDIPTCIDRVVAGGAERLVVVPYFLHPGNHTLRDIPATITDARARHPNVPIEQAAVFGADPALVSALADQVRSALGAP
ncbi:MAG: CbiX/SirB N-terminal domain-containing protein [Actinomycetota bacterium]|nr:CbiX/SirB N-terminal domain-containing protein [Actinomycetota bacterium]